VRPVSEHSQPLIEGDADADPLRQFARWFDDAARAGVRMPEAVALATAGADDAPSLRMVLMKGYDELGFRFFTNYDSRKATQLAANPRAALLFHWDPLGRQVRIEGPVRQTTPAESAAYFRSRPRGSQISALASPQSEVIESRAWLEERVDELSSRLAGEEPPVPANWGGFRLAPQRFEFWQSRDDRLHDRLLYTPAAGGGWRIERLAP
jgi:pyridoxamine 5'-phosphate oxidase